MPFSYPQDTDDFRKERKSYQILFYKLNTDVWSHNGPDSTDHGMDYGFEYIEDSQYKGFRILSQIKSTSHLMTQKDAVVFDLPVKTAAYAVSCAQPFVLFLVDLEDGTVYYQCLQDFFIENSDSFLALGKNKSTVRVKLPKSQIVTREIECLKDVAKSRYALIGKVLQKIQ